MTATYRIVNVVLLSGLVAIAISSYRDSRTQSRQSIDSRPATADAEGSRTESLPQSVLAEDLKGQFIRPEPR